MTLKCTMILGDCLDVVPTLVERIPLVLADLPFGVSGCDWDVRISLSGFWKALTSVLPASWLILAHCTQPFTTDIICSNRPMFRYELVWGKRRATGFFNAKRAPLRAHESIAVIGNGTTYNPQMVTGKKYSVTKHQAKRGFYGQPIAIPQTSQIQNGTTRYPKSVIYVDETDLRRDRLNGHSGQLAHPTQKPLALLDWLIRTYSNERDIVIDPTSGSFTTSVAACLSGRSSIGIEKDPGYFEAGVERVRKACVDGKLDVAIEVRR